MDKDKLFAIADRQQGYFTAKQAESCGAPQSHFPRRLRSGEWVREARGIYRLAHYPILERSELVLWTLWSTNRQGIPQGVWSHETALDIHGLTDAMPSKMHLTVPSSFRRSAPIPTLLRLHYANLDDSDFQQRRGYRVTTPLRTLLDITMARTLDPGLVAQGVQQAFERGLINRRAFDELKEASYLKDLL